MLVVSLRAGEANILPDSLPVTPDLFGYNFTGFRGLGRFKRQLADDPVGLISWPGGSVAENMSDRYGLSHPDLWVGQSGVGLSDLFATARQQDAGVSVVIPTLPYVGREDALQADISSFVARLGYGSFGPLPKRLILEVGSEYYATFGPGVDSAMLYGQLASRAVLALTDALGDPDLNPAGIAPEIAVQNGLTLEDDDAIRAELDDDALRQVDLLILHRFPHRAAGSDNAVETLEVSVDAWAAEMAELGAGRPAIYMSSYNVASLTREEALSLYLDQQEAAGAVADAALIDLQARNDAGFEQFWQDQLQDRDYGIQHPRVLMELQARGGALGMSAASAYGIDMQHAARLTWMDESGRPQDMVAQDLLDMMAESTQGTRLLSQSLRNRPADDVWTYGYESPDKLVAFVMWRGQAPGPVQVKVTGLLQDDYRAVWAESLREEIPDDWMARYGIPDHPDVDETPESHSFATGLREAVDLSFDRGRLILQATHETQIIRLVFAKTEAGMEDISRWAGTDPVSLLRDLPDAPLPDPVAEARPALELLLPEPSPEAAPFAPQPADASAPPPAAPEEMALTAGAGTLAEILGGAVLAIGLLALVA